MASHMCPVCGNDEFDEQDGLFFCTECATQSQEFHVQETADPFANENQTVRLKRIREKRQPETNVDKESILGRPWTIYEAYQYIILAQVDALIELGASADLKDIVYLIWANYLRKLGVAFCRIEKLVPDIVLKSGRYRQRELNRGSFANPRNRFKSKQSESSAAEDKLQQLIDEEDGGRIDLPGPVMSASGQKKRYRHTRSSHRTRTTFSRWRAHYSSPEWMDMEKTITFCYMGLRIMEQDHILPHDVVRWIHEGKIPFLSAAHVLPEDMVLSGEDWKLFHVRKTFTCLVLRTELEKIVRFLSLREPLPTISVDRVIYRFLEELALPKDLAPSCLQLAHTFPFHYGGSLSRGLDMKTDIAALAYIITTLNLALDLNGQTECELSDVSRKLQSLIGPAPSLFVWEDWRQVTRDRFHNRFDSCAEFSRPFDQSSLKHMDSLIQCYKTIGAQWKLSTAAITDRLKVFTRCTKAFQDELTGLLGSALDTMNLGHSSSAETGSCERDRQQLDVFRQSTMCHILDPTAFRDNYRQQVSLGGEDAAHLLDFLQSRPKTFRPFTAPDGNSPGRQRGGLWDGDCGGEEWSGDAGERVDAVPGGPVWWLVGLGCQLVGCDRSNLARCVAGLHKCVVSKNSAPDLDLTVTLDGPMPPSIGFKSKMRKRRKVSPKRQRSNSFVNSFVE